ncbi:MAG: hypothetical protein JNM86_02105 [Phycisphaerae bacterium]|nr:hypothetical protein [Phycisphaerae bacterium]MBN8598652.1 hypothetical protein [Planctomycetota bacterium]
MRQLRTKQLVGLNLALAGALAGFWFLSSASAQPANPGSGRGRGEYLMIASGIPGSNANNVQILDVSNQELLTLRFDQGRRAYVVNGYRSLGGDRNIPGGR